MAAASALIQCNFRMVSGFMIPSYIPNQYHPQSCIKMYQSAATAVTDGQDDDEDFDDMTNFSDVDNIDDEDEFDGDEDDDVMLDDGLSLDEIQLRLNDYTEDGDEDFDDNDEEYEDDGLVSSASSSSLPSSTKAIGYDLDASVETVVQQYMQTYQTMMSQSDTSTSVPKMAIIQGWFTEMNGWNIDQYNQLIQEISQIGSVRDTETILYHLIQHHQQQTNNNNDVNGEDVLINDETFYHVVASYQYRQKQQKKNKNKKNRGIGFKVEQILAIQDALSNQLEIVANTPTSNDKSNPIQPSIDTLNAVLYAMTLDRNDHKIALRAHRIWDRMLRMVVDANTSSSNNNINNSNMDDDPNARLLSNAVLSTLICCTHVPRMTATPADKLSSFTVALECFNWATTTNSARTTTTTSDGTLQLPALPQHQSSAYMYFLRACRVLLSETTESKRDAVVEAAFRRACTNGYVDTKVVKAMEEIASDALMLRLLGGFIEDGQDLPVEWSRNCMMVRSSKKVEEATVSNDTGR